MQQQIGFGATADGVRIAYATVGSGPALVVASYPPSHLGLEWEEPRVRDFWEAIGRNHLVVRYDKHGSGLSDRNRTDFSLDFEIRTIESIVTQLRLKSFALWGQGTSGAAAAISYAIKFPDRLSHLILCNAQARWHGPTWGGTNLDTARALMLSNWRMASLAYAETQLGSEFDAPALQWLLRIWEEAARSFELRATISLARLLAKQGRRDEARTMLAEIYGWFTEGFDTADLKDAKTLFELLNA
jgi:pimeloyl-ACP methyl ester carboxylesterase